MKLRAAGAVLFLFAAAESQDPDEDTRPDYAAIGEEYQKSCIDSFGGLERGEPLSIESCAELLHFERTESDKKNVHKQFASVWSQNSKKSMLDMAEALFRVLDKEDVTSFMHAGSLLGAVRHHAMIPWDDDFDIAVKKDKMDTSYPMLANKLKGLGYTLYKYGQIYKLFPSNAKKIPKPQQKQSKKTADKPHNSNFRSSHRKKATGSVMDLEMIQIEEEQDTYAWGWPFIDLFPFEEKEGKVSIAWRGDQPIQVEDMFPLQTAKFEHFLVRIPAHPDRVLNTFYGGKRNQAGTFDAPTLSPLKFCIANHYDHSQEHGRWGGPLERVLCNELPIKTYTKAAVVDLTSSKDLPSIKPTKADKVVHRVGADHGHAVHGHATRAGSKIATGIASSAHHHSKGMSKGGRSSSQGGKKSKAKVQRSESGRHSKAKGERSPSGRQKYVKKLREQFSKGSVLGKHGRHSLYD